MVYKDGKEGAVNGTPLGLEFWFICWACLVFTNVYYLVRFHYLRQLMLSPGGLMTRLNAVEQWLKRVPLTAPLLGWNFGLYVGLVGSLRMCIPSQIPLS
jgi:hypothetical protein